ncbi:MFS transporter [Glycomyces xiaoerkulensis]|uniref:MFS transporter n=1 Tax=Glycomyces xiaoerkulensis TaxID=2038139 RepID=UPI0018E40DF1|nr:MFS transporter [Glycomyces xiaoerkulensis]
MSAAAVPNASSTIATALSVNVAAVMPVFLFGGLAVQIAAELGMRPGTIGLVSGLYFAVAGLTAVPSGRLVERFGAPAMARLGVALAAGSMLAIAAFAQHTAVLIALMIVSAPANGLGQLSSNTVLSNWAPGRHKGLLFGAKQASVPLCTMLAGLSVPAIALTLGWRWAFVAGGAVALLSLIPLNGLGRPERPAGNGDGRVFDRRLLMFALATCLSAGAATPLGTFLTTYAVDIGASESFAGLNLTVGGLAGVLARTAVGAIADRRGGGEFGLIVVMLLGGAIGISTLMIGQPWLLPLGTAAGFALGWAWPGLMNFAVTKRYPDAPAAATSITQTGVYLGGAVGPIAFGLLVDHGGWTAGWTASVAAMTFAAVFIVAGGRPRHRTAR